MVESKLVALILYISINYDRGYLGVRRWLPTPRRIFATLLRQISYLPPIFARWLRPASHTLRDEYLVGVVKLAVIPPFPSTYE